MARKAAWEDLAEGDLGPYGKSRGTRWGRVFAVLLLVAGATFVAAYYLPLYRAHLKLGEQYRELVQRSRGLSETVTKTQGELKAVTEARDQLQAAHDARENAKKSTSDQQERVRLALSSKLDKFLKKGSAALRVDAGSLVVAFDSALLFVPQKLDLTPAGRALVCDVVKTSDAKAFQRARVTGRGLGRPASASRQLPEPMGADGGSRGRRRAGAPAVVRGRCRAAQRDGQWPATSGCWRKTLRRSDRARGRPGCTLTRSAGGAPNDDAARRERPSNVPGDFVEPIGIRTDDLLTASQALSQLS